MGENKDKITINKIEIDDKTATPSIVSLPVKKVEKEQAKLENAQKKASKKSGETPASQISDGQISMRDFLDADGNNSSVKNRQKVFKRVFSSIFVVFVLAVFVWTFYNDFFGSPDKPRVSFLEILSIVGSNWYFLIIAIFCLFLVYLLKGLKLSILCKSMTNKFHFKTCVETGIVGVYYNNITPLGFGGQPFEIYHLSKHGIHGGVASSLPIITFFFNQFAFVVLGVIALAAFRENAFNVPPEMYSVIPFEITSTMAIIGLICCMLMPLLVITFSLMPRVCSKLVHGVMHIGNKLRIIKDPKLTAMKTMKTVFQNSQYIKKTTKSPVAFTLILLLSFGEQLAQCSIAYFTLKFFGFDWKQLHGVGEWIAVIQLCLILFSAVSFIPTPGNSGAADLSFYLLFETGLVAGLAFPAMLVWRFLNFYSVILIGFLFTSFKHKADRKKLSEQLSDNNL